MKKVKGKLLTSYAGHSASDEEAGGVVVFAHEKGDVIEMDEPEAKRIFAAGYAVPFEEAPGAKK